MALNQMLYHLSFLVPNDITWNFHVGSYQSYIAGKGESNHHYATFAM
jgi:hypothetical protein